MQPISADRVECKESKSGYSIKASEKDIKRIIKEFTSAAVRCVNAGFDGVELHGAHGYLISQFLSKSILTIKPKVGDFYFFPNYVMHTVYPFADTDEERRSVSFNANLDQDIVGIA